MTHGETRRGPGRPPTIDLKGQTFGHLTVLERVEYGWRCKCACGDEKVLTTADLRWNGRKSCGCGYGRSIARSDTGVGGMQIGPAVRAILPQRIRKVLIDERRAQPHKECPICRYGEAKRLTMWYGTNHESIRRVVDDRRNYMIVCELCYKQFRKFNGAGPDQQGSPSLWATLLLGPAGEQKQDEEINKELVRPLIELFRKIEPPGAESGLNLSRLHGFADRILGEVTNDVG